MRSSEVRGAASLRCALASAAALLASFVLIAAAPEDSPLLVGQSVGDLPWLLWILSAILAVGGLALGATAARRARAERAPWPRALVFGIALSAFLALLPLLALLVLLVALATNQIE